MSSSKAEKEKLQLIQEKSQQILSELLKDEDNKYCVDCDAKGPRWASWNIGVFLCIRCAGIHRNLGVHISKVKSVNLDSWSPEQVAYMQMMGNSKARAVYEANLPDNFKRPQADSALEAFVRAKYEQKKYIAKEWVPPANPKPAFDIEEERKKEKEKKRNKIVKGQTNSAIVEVQTNPVPRPHSSPAGTAINAEKVLNNKNGSGGIKLPPSNDLLGLNTSASVKSNASDDDGFDAFVSCAPVSSAATTSAKPTDELVNVDAKSKTNEEEDFFNQKAPEQKKLDKESILKLYESSNPVQNKLFNLTSSAPLQPMNLNGQFSNPLAGQPANNPLSNNPLTNNPLTSNPLTSNPLTSNSLFPTAAQSNVISNGFANFSNQPPASNQQQPPPFLAFNQTNVIPSTLPQSSTNPFLSAPATNGATPNLPSTDLFSSAGHLQPVTTLGSQLNGLNLTANTATDTGSINWPTNSNSISTGQSLFSANFDQLNASDKKLNGVLPPAGLTSTAANPFLGAGTTPIQPTSSSNLDILSAFGGSAANGLSNFGSLNGGLNKSNSENWSTLHTSTTNNGLTANNGLTSGLADIWQ